MFRLTIGSLSTLLRRRAEFLRLLKSLLLALKEKSFSAASSHSFYFFFVSFSSFSEPVILSSHCGWDEKLEFVNSSALHRANFAREWDEKKNRGRNSYCALICKKNEFAYARTTAVKEPKISLIFAQLARSPDDCSIASRTAVTMIDCPACRSAPWWWSMCPCDRCVANFPVNSCCDDGGDSTSDASLASFSFSSHRSTMSPCLHATTTKDDLMSPRREVPKSPEFKTTRILLPIVGHSDSEEKFKF